MEWKDDGEGRPALSSDGFAFRLSQGRPPFPVVAEELDGDKWHRIGPFREAAEAMARCEDLITHRRELKSLVRRDMPSDQRPRNTPWGPAQHGTAYGDGDSVVFWHTAGHGGFKLKGAAAERIPEALRQKDGWYEEDVDWGAVGHFIPELFTSVDRRSARGTLVNWRPHEFEAATGETIPRESSHKLREEDFRKAHADDLVAISAVRDDARPGMTKVTATLGGLRGDGSGSPETREFAVPSGEYRMGEFGFVVDPERYEEIGQPQTPQP